VAQVVAALWPLAPVLCRTGRCQRLDRRGAEGQVAVAARLRVHDPALKSDTCQCFPTYDFSCVPGQKSMPLQGVRGLLSMPC
jgi:hypothetical protein